jgi:two-component system, chemotaxis family, response regulator PixH
MDETRPRDEVLREIDESVRRVERHRAMLAHLAVTQAQTLSGLKALVERTGGQAAGGMSLPEIDEEIRSTALLRGLVTGGAAGPARATPKVLLVDDDPTTRNLISHFLRKENFLVEKAIDGSEGLAKAKNGRPDLIIVEASVPGTSGFELLSLLKREPETAFIPTLLLSSIDEEEEIVKGLEEGADYILKPFSPRVLVAKVKKVLREARDHAEHRRSL